jgi:hypothetical protein
MVNSTTSSVNSWVEVSGGRDSSITFGSISYERVDINARKSCYDMMFCPQNLNLLCLQLCWIR